MASDAVKVHRDHCRAVQADVEERLGRLLTESERLRIWNCPSGQMREMLEMAAYYAKVPQDVERALAEFPAYPALPNDFTEPDGNVHLEYASPPKPDPKRRDLFRLALIGTIFGIAYLAFLFWWTLFR